MNMKKIISIGAMTLAITCSTSITTFASDNTGSRNEAAKDIAINFYKGGQVVNNVKININTPIKNYASEKLISEIKSLDITGFNVNLGIKENFEKLQANQDDLTEVENLNKIKQFIKVKLEDFIIASEEGNLKETVKDYILVDKYGVLTTGKNMDGKTTLSLENTSGKILLQVNSDEVKDAKAKVAGVNSWSELKAVIGNYIDIDGILSK